MQRIFKRSGLPIWYSEGFNPHIYIMFLLPLSLGYESSVELMDFKLNEELPFDKIVDDINAVMPEGLKVVKAFLPVNKHTAIKFASYKINFRTKNPEKLREEFEKFMSQEQINTIKKSKKTGEKLIDLKPDIKIESMVDNDEIFEVNAIFPTGTDKNLNPSLLTDLFEKYCEDYIQSINVERTNIFTENCKDIFE